MVDMLVTCEDGGCVRVCWVTTLLVWDLSYTDTGGELCHLPLIHVYAQSDIVNELAYQLLYQEPGM